MTTWHTGSSHANLLTTGGSSTNTIYDIWIKPNKSDRDWKREAIKYDAHEDTHYDLNDE